ncbi:MAG: hypothetical protein AAFQ82_19285 [Myxococcota bacterium]
MNRPILLATCEEWSELHPDDRGIIDVLAQRGITALPAVWNDPNVQWHTAAAVVLRSTWDYTRNREAFLRWLDGLSCPLFNPSDVVRWNTDKVYLSVLGDAGLPVTPTVYLKPGEAVFETLGGEHVVVKPSVSAGSQDTIRLRANDRSAIESHVAGIHAQGKTAMIQPYLDAVDGEGETALLFFGGVFSHAIRKGPLLREVGRLATDGLFAAEAIEARTPSDAEKQLGARVLEALPFETPLYARVDLIPGPEGAPMILEVELTEPSLFFEFSAGSHERYVDALVTRL